MPPFIACVLCVFLSTLSLRRATVNGDAQSSCFGNFYPRSPCGERPGCQRPCEHPTRDFYPRSPCGERPTDMAKRLIQFGISIHALLAESDSGHCGRSKSKTHFYPRSPCGERRDVIAVMTDAQSISIHALLAESDCGRWSTLPIDTVKFLSTLSLRRATVVIPGPAVMIPISIHALLAESDFRRGGVFYSHADFYPRSPCGERL